MLRHTILGELIPTPRGIRFTEDGDVVTNAEMIRMNLREYMKQMYSPADIVRPEFLTSTYVFPESAAVMDSPFTMEELREAIMKVGRVACGVDGIPNELMKVLVQSTMDSILMNTCLLICNLIFKGYSTKRINTSVISMVPKKPKAEFIDEFRPIAVSTTFSKLVSSMVNKRLLQCAVNNKVLSPEQSGFLPYQECAGQVLSLLNIAKTIEDKVGSCYLANSRSWLEYNTCVFLIQSLSLDKEYAATISSTWIQMATTSIPVFIEGVKVYFTQTEA